MKHIFYCNKCQKFTMKEFCECSSKTSSQKPAKYSPMSRFSGYRREAKREELKSRGVL